MTLLKKGTVIKVCGLFLLHIISVDTSSICLCICSWPIDYFRGLYACLYAHTTTVHRWAGSLLISFCYIVFWVGDIRYLCSEYLLWKKAFSMSGENFLLWSMVHRCCSHCKVGQWHWQGWPTTQYGLLVLSVPRIQWCTCLVGDQREFMH